MRLRNQVGQVALPWELVALKVFKWYLHDKSMALHAKAEASTTLSCFWITLHSCQYLPQPGMFTHFAPSFCTPCFLGGL